MTGSVEFLLRETDDGVSFGIQVQPRASRNELCGIQGDALKLRLTSPPVEGAANKQCIELIAGLFGVPRRNVSIITGETSRHKTVRVVGVTGAEVRRIVASTLGR